MKKHEPTAEELRILVSQQAAIVEIGQRALAGVDLSTLMSEAVALVARVLQVEYCKILELLPGGDALLLRAGVGWKEGLVGQATVSAGTESQAGYTLLSASPVIVEDLSAETRFSGPPLLHEHGVVSGISVIIEGRGGPFGILGAHTTRRRTFTQDDINFLQAIANVLATAIERQQAEEALRASEERLRTVVSGAPVVLFALDRDGVFTLSEGKALDALGLKPGEVVGQSVFDVYRDTPPITGNIRRVLAGEEFVSTVEVGGLVFQTQYSPIRDGGQVVGAIGVAIDVTERARAEKALWESEQHYRSLFDAAGDAICTISADGTIISLNAGFEMITGWSRIEWVGRPFADVIHPEDRRLALEMQRRAFAREIPPPSELRIRAKSGEYKVGEFRVTSLTREGEVVAALAIGRDITERKRMEAQLVYLANYDPLTNLLNRRRFQEELERHLAQTRHYGVPAALLWLDLDRFKEINDSLGHKVGDELLVNIASSLREQLRETDVLARVGGDEFAILMPHTDARQALAAADRILEAMRCHSVYLRGQPVRLTTSIGVVPIPGHANTAEHLMTHADLALYDAKQKGRDRFSLYEPDKDWEVQVVSRLAWTRRIREALANNTLLLYAQPILDIKSGQISRYELLLRMADNGGEVILPGAFLDVAERFDLIQDSDRWVVYRAIRLLAQQQWVGPEILLEANLSAKALTDDVLIPLIQNELAAAGIDPARLVLEITETAAVADLNQARKFIESLKRIGCQFAIDDFGAGFSSFYYLKHLPIDYLKIDGSFIRDLPRNPVDQHLVKAMVEIAKGLNIETIAEHVEDQEILQLLREYGADYAQGYYIGRPRPVQET